MARFRGQAAAIGGGSLTESGNTAGETFTVTVNAGLSPGQTDVSNSVSSSAGACPSCTVVDPLQAQLSVTKAVPSRMAILSVRLAPY